MSDKAQKRACKHEERTKINQTQMAHATYMPMKPSEDAKRRFLAICCKAEALELARERICAGGYVFCPPARLNTTFHVAQCASTASEGCSGTRWENAATGTGASTAAGARSAGEGAEAQQEVAARLRRAKRK